MLKKYRIWCETEKKYVITWSMNPIKRCPHNSSHDVNVGSVAEIGDSNQMTRKAEMVTSVCEELRDFVEDKLQKIYPYSSSVNIEPYRGDDRELVLTIRLAKSEAEDVADRLKQEGRNLDFDGMSMSSMRTSLSTISSTIPMSIQGIQGMQGWSGSGSSLISVNPATAIGMGMGSQVGMANSQVTTAKIAQSAVTAAKLEPTNGGAAKGLASSLTSKKKLIFQKP